MSDTDKRMQQIIKSAEKAIAKIADPARRAKAIAKLEATRKQVNKGKPTASRTVRQLEKARDRDFDR